MEEAPRHQQIGGQAGFDPVVVSQLPVFDLAAGLERPMEDLDSLPSLGPRNFPEVIYVSTAIPQRESFSTFNEFHFLRRLPKNNAETISGS